MIELDNITLREYFELEDRSEYDFAILYAKPFQEVYDTFGIGSLFNKPFGKVKEFQQAHAEGLTWEQLTDWIAEFSGKKLFRISSTGILEFMKGKNHLFKEIETINTVEAEKLGYTPKAEEREAGIDDAKEFGFYPQLLSIANGDGLRVKEAEELEYSYAFLYLSYSNWKSNYQTRLMELQNKKLK